MLTNGEKVLAKWKDGRYYPAIIQKCLADSVVVKFIEDKVIHTLKMHLVNSLTPSSKKKNCKRRKCSGMSENSTNGNNKKQLCNITESATNIKQNEQCLLENEIFDFTQSEFSQQNQYMQLNEIENQSFDINELSELAEPNESLNSVSSSGSDYIPSESESMDSDLEENFSNFDVDNIRNTESLESQMTIKSTTTDGIFVIPTKNIQGTRKWDKKYYCPFCDNSFAKLPRHLENKHSDESEVRKLLALKGNKLKKSERENIIRKLRNIGNHRHNCRVLRKGGGKLSVVYRPSEKKCVNPHNYIPCPKCYGYYAKKELWKHKCSFRELKKKNERVVAKARSLLPVPFFVENNVKELLSSMRQDKITNVIKSDKTICEFMRRMFYSKGGEQNHRKSEIRNNAREIARLLLELRKTNKSESLTLENAIEPSNYRDLLNAVRTVAGFEHTTKKFAVPELARKLGLHIKSCAQLVQCSAIEENNAFLLEKIEKFLKLHEMTFFPEVGANAERNKNERRRNKEDIIPLSKDVIALNNYLKSLSEKQIEKLNSHTILKVEKITAWTTLQKTTLVQILMFNRRREGEISRMKVADYEERKESNERSDVEEILTKSENALCRILTRVEIQGKGDRTVPVLLTPKMKTALNLLLKWREDVGVAESNPFLFASCTYGAKLHYRGSTCLRKFSKECGAIHPDSLRSTKLRKHVASLSQILNLKEYELDALASFMGHDIRIHRDYYRLPDKVFQVAKLSKIFLAMEKGNLQKNIGRSLDEIHSQVEEDSEQTISSRMEIIATDKDGCAPSTSSLSSISDDDKAYLNEEQKLESINDVGKTFPSKRPWEEKEKEAVEKHLSMYIFAQNLPGADAIRKCIAAEPVLHNRNWKNVKDYCRNRITAISRKSKI